MSAATNHEKLSTRLKLIYGLGDWGAAAATTARNVFWFFFITSVVGLDAGPAGFIFLIGRIWDGINDPLVGSLSDRLRTRWGRRRPLLLFGAVPFGLTFALLFSVPPLDTELGKVIYYTFVFLLFDTLFTVINVPYSALAPELTADFDERSNLAGWRIAISILASLVTGGLFKLLAEQLFAGWFGGSLPAGYFLAAGLWGLSMIFPLLLLFGAIQEAPQAPDTDPFRPGQTFREVFSNHPFRLAAIIYLLTFSAVDIVLLIFIRFLVDYVRVSAGFDNLLLAVVLLLAFITMPLTVALMRRFGKRQTYIISMTFMSLVLLIVSQVPPGGQNLMLLAAILAGLGYGAANVIPWAIVGDVIEVDELQSGKRREGLYYGYLVFFRKLASALAAFGVGQLLDAAGFVSGTQGSAFIEQPPSALLAMRFLIGVAPAVLIALAIFTAWRYPLDRETYNAVRRQLAEKRINNV